MGLDALTPATEGRNSGRDALPYDADWLLYFGMVVCSVFKALVGRGSLNADVVAYLDLSDAIRDHRWHDVVNGYWFPGYPAALTAARALSGFSARYDLMVARLVTCFTDLLFVVASVVLAWSVRRLMLNRGIKESELLPARILYLWVAGFSYIFAFEDLVALTPDALVSALMILTAAALIWTRAGGGLISYVSVGLFAALAFWTKTFAFSFFVLLILFVVLADISRLRITLPRFAVSVLVFALIAGPYVWKLSAAKGRLTFGDTGKLNFAWYENGVDRFNPVDDPAICRRGTARISFKHPGELLASLPEITYYGGHGIQGSTPQWDDPSFWWDGMSPRVNLKEIARTVMMSLATIFSILIMRFQAVLFVLALYLGGFALRKRSWVDPVMPALFVVALACISLYALILVEGRYIAFALVLVGTLFAGSVLAGQNGKGHRSLNLAISLMLAIVLVSGIQASLRDWKAASREGAHPLRGIYDRSVLSAGADLAHRFGPGTEMACMGAKACWADPYWAKYAGIRITAFIESGNGWNDASAQAGCEKLQENLSTLAPLRDRHVRAIVARFDGTRPCSTEWQPLGESPDFFYRPI